MVTSHPLLSSARLFLACLFLYSCCISPVFAGFICGDDDGRTPVNIVFSLDYSGSMAGDLVANLRTAVASFVDELTGSDYVGAVLWDSQSLKKVALTQDFGDITDAVDNTNPSGGTDYRVGLQQAFNIMEASPDGSFEKIIIFMSDGSPTYPFNVDTDAGMQDIIDGGYKMYTIGMKSEVELLTKMAERTGGKFFLAESADDITDAFSEVHSDVLLSILQDISCVSFTAFLLLLLLLLLLSLCACCLFLVPIIASTALITGAGGSFLAGKTLAFPPGYDATAAAAIIPFGPPPVPPAPEVRTGGAYIIGGRPMAVDWGHHTVPKSAPVNDYTPPLPAVTMPVHTMGMGMAIGAAWTKYLLWDKLFGLCAGSKK
ncbi:von Willebrand factor type A domain [Carpediemonas membranifera]|uniref:von Willebrand factor type A domain n=1 Tax=Carpediemonas membranifera TaxID=201153 RepID=A0A8J6AYG3_9EUKA|nr:von Willebrand factor type A domain [Carpediemonas membranifera]|eukprot:KAG9397153.1 von Willebrand factor type A domain [Carpediemonas membranifera]